MELLYIYIYNFSRHNLISQFLLFRNCSAHISHTKNLCRNVGQCKHSYKKDQLATTQELYTLVQFSLYF